MSLTDPTAFYALAIPPFDELGALELNPTIAFTMVDRMLGGTGARRRRSNRALTEIEQNVVDSVVKLLLESPHRDLARRSSTLDFGIRGRETRPQMLQVAAPNEVVILLVFDVKIGDVARHDEPLHSGQHRRGHRRPLRAGAGTARAATRPRPSAAGCSENLARVPLEVTRLLETQLRARTAGPQARRRRVARRARCSRPVDVRVGETLKFKGRLTTRRGRAGVRVERRTEPAT